MSESRNEGEDPGGLPRATVKRRRWRISVVWAVPLAAAAVAGYLMVGHVREFGPEIAIRFEDAGGVKPEQTPILYRGVPVGEVRSVELGKDRKHAVVRARLRRRDASIAREGAMFWIVRPEVGFSSITGLGTVITGPRIEVLPGAGAPKREFTGLENPPVVSDPEGLQIVLLTARLGSLHPGSPVFYRGVEVGAVRDYRLGPDATTVHIRVSVRKRYANLVREGSKFWNVSGVDVSVGLIRGMEIRMESLGSLVKGGITFATPDNTAEGPVKDGAVFRLYENPEKQWLAWNPKISIPQEN